MKTLKDLEGWDEHHGAVSRLDLKQAAIEWIKELESGDTLLSNGFPITDSRFEEYKDMSSIIFWIKSFFNIGKEDLIQKQNINCRTCSKITTGEEISRLLVNDVTFVKVKCDECGEIMIGESK